MSRRPRAPLAALVAGVALLSTIGAREPAADRALVAGLAAFHGGDWQGGERLLADAAAQAPDWAAAHAALARVRLARGNAAGAEAALRRAQALGYPDVRVTHLQAHLRLLQGDPAGVFAFRSPPAAPPETLAYAARIEGQAAVRLGDWTRAAAAFGAAERFGPRLASVWVDSAWYRLAIGDLGGAIAAGERAYRLRPGRPDVAALVARLTRVRNGLAAALPWYERALERDPGNRALLAEAAAAFGDAGRARTMLALTRRLLLAERNHPQALYLQAVMAARAGRYDLARTLAYRIGNRLDHVPGMQLLRAALELEGGSKTAAIDRLEPLLALQPRNLRVRMLLASAQHQSGDAAGVIATLGPVVGRRDATPYALTLAARAHEAAGRREEAALLLDRAARAERAPPDFFDPAQALRAPTRADGSYPDAIVAAGDVLAARGARAEAIAAYRRAAWLRFDEATALRLYAALADGGDPGGAAAVLAELLRQTPRSIDAQLLIAGLLLREGQGERAAILLETVRRRIGNGDPALLANLATTAARAGDDERALRLARMAYARAPRTPAVTLLLAELAARDPEARDDSVALRAKAEAIRIE